MNTQFDEWLAQLRRAGKGAVSLTIDRGLPFRWQFAMQGSWVGSSVSAALRLYPDAPSVLVPFGASPPTYQAAGDVTLFTVTLTKEQTAALPADGSGEALVPLAFDLLFTPAGSIQQRLFGGVVTVAGKVTDAA